MIEEQPEPKSFFEDEEFQDRLVALLVLDAKTLHECGALLTPEDFKPLKGMKRGRARWITAERALEHYKKYHEPLDRLLRAEVLEYASQIGLGSDQVNQLRDYVRWLQTVKVTAPNSIVEKVVRYKQQRLKAGALQEMVELQSAGMLTDEKWQELSRKALAAVNSMVQTTDYIGDLDNREQRRRTDGTRLRVPWTYIDPLDSLVRTVGPRELGLVLAPWKRGKSLMLLWLAVAYVIQRLNVLYVTLEDTQAEVEDRLDANITAIPIHSLREYPQAIRRRFNRWRTMVSTQLKIYDGTEGGVSIQRLEQVIQAEREKGFIPHAVFVDYDKEIEPAKHYQDRRFESDSTYRALRQLNARYNTIGWTASQTQRDTRHLKILSGDKVGEDIGKIQKVTCAIGMGRGDWTQDSIYLWVAAHKCDRMEVGCEIVPDLQRMIIYDRDATYRAYKQNCPQEEE